MPQPRSLIQEWAKIEYRNGKPGSHNQHQRRITTKKEKQMLLHPTLDKLKSLRLDGMLAALNDQEALPERRRVEL